MFYQIKDYEKRFACSLLGSGWKKETDVKKDQYKFLRDEVYVINNNIQDNVKVKDDVKTDGGTIVNVDRKYIGDESKNLIANNF